MNLTNKAYSERFLEDLVHIRHQQYERKYLDFNYFASSVNALHLLHVNGLKYFDNQVSHHLQKLVGYNYNKFGLSDAKRFDIIQVRLKTIIEELLTDGRVENKKEYKTKLQNSKKQLKLKELSYYTKQYIDKIIQYPKLAEKEALESCLIVESIEDIVLDVSGLVENLYKYEKDIQSIVLSHVAKHGYYKKSYYYGKTIRDQNFYVKELDNFLNSLFIYNSIQLDDIYSMTNKDTKEFFQYILNIKAINIHLNDNSVKRKFYVLGDADGSLGRLFLFGIQSGHIVLCKPELEKLCKILELESRYKKNYPRYQLNKDISEIMYEIVSEAMYIRHPINQFICIGDVRFDRFTVNCKATDLLIEKLVNETGAIFIAGNHDILGHVGQIRGDQAGRHAYIKNDKSLEQSKKFEEDYLTNCYYQNSVIYIHNGFKIVEYENTSKYKLLTAYGGFDLEDYSSIDELVHAINDKSKNHFSKRRVLDYDYSKKLFFKSNLTNFRPNYNDMDNVVTVLKKIYNLEYLLIVHGHNGLHNVAQFTADQNVLTVNSRRKDKDSDILQEPCPVSCILNFHK